MGGKGSGRRNGQAAKGLVEATPRLWLRDGIARWFQPGREEAIARGAAAGTRQLAQLAMPVRWQVSRAPGGQLDVRVSVGSFAQRLAVVKVCRRWLWQCPHCRSRRVIALFLSRDIGWCCRSCARLSYRSQRMPQWRRREDARAVAAARYRVHRGMPPAREGPRPAKG